MTKLDTALAARAAGLELKTVLILVDHVEFAPADLQRSIELAIVCRDVAASRTTLTALLATSTTRAQFVASLAGQLDANWHVAT